MCCIQHGAAAAALEDGAHFVCVARQHSDSMAYTCIHKRVFCVCVRVCVFVWCQGHWQKAEVLLGCDFSFLFAPAVLPFRVRLLCSAFCINCIFSLPSHTPTPQHGFPVFLIVVGAFGDIFIHSNRLCVCVRVRVRLSVFAWISD